MAGRSGSYLGGAQYQGTVDSLIACLGSILAPRPSKSVTVTFEAGEGTVSPKTLTRQSGQPFGTLPVPTRKNYVFMGWKCKVPSSDEDGYAFYHYFGGAAVLPEDIVPYEDVTLVAQWEDRRVYVYFMRQYTPNGAYYWQYGNYYQRGCAYGELPEDDPTMTGYAFLGWYSEKKWGERIDETSIVPDQTTPVTNYAHWIANEYKVRYNANDTDEFPAEGEMRVQTFRYDLAEELRPNAFVREGYDFQGWTTHPDWTYVYYKDAQLISNLTSKADETVDLYAAWKARQVTITFDMNDFPNFQDTEKQLTVGSPFSWQIPSVYSTRYVVDGFYTARKGGVELLATTSVPARDTTYYLQWHKKHYSVAFNANGGSGAMAPQDFVYGESQRLSENAFAKAGSLFSGWATSPDGEVRYADRQRVTDLEATEGGTFQLYAKWEPTVELGPAPVADGGPYRQTVGKYTWTFRVSDGRVSICNDNESAYQCAVSPSPTGSVDVPDVLGGRPVVDVSAHAFRSCDNVERIVLPPSVEQIGSYAFIGCSSLTNVVFGPNVKSIGWGAFWNCGSLDGVRIPASVVSIGDAAFSLCDSLVDLTVETENRNYCMIDGALYTKDAGELLRCSPMISTCVVPKSVRRVGNSCFAPIVWGMSPKGVMLENVYFMGNAPEGNPFNGAPAELTCYAREGSCGWIDSQTTALPETWPSSNGRRIVRWEDEPPMTYAVTFDLGEHGTRTGGGELEQTVVGGAAATVPTVAVASGYELVGWDPAPDCVTADMTVRALYRHTEAFAPGHYTVSTNGYAWSFTVTDRGAKIERGNEEKQRAVEPTPVGAVEIPSELGGWPVTAIGCYAFYYCDQMTSVTIPSSVTNIADYAFTYCKGLRSVTIPSSVTAIGYSFGGCKALQALAFNGNEPLYLGKGATFAPRSTVVLVREDSQGWRDGSDFIEIWPRNFGPTCPVRLWNGTMAEGDIVYELGRDGKNAADNPHFYIDALLPRKLSAPTREGYAFKGWTLDGREVTEIPVGTTGDVVLTAQWEEVPAEPGWGWSDGTRQWRYVTVEYNDNGTTKTGAKISNDGECAVSPRPQGVLTVPPAIDGYPVVEVEEFAFADCMGLTSVVLPSCFIGNDLTAKVFAGCENLTLVCVDQGGSEELYNVKDGLLLYRDDWLVLCPPGLANPVIPETVQTLEKSAFYENRKMTRIAIPDGVSTISGECFKGCENLSEIVCRTTLTSFSGNPFQGTAWEAAQGDIVVMNGVLLDYHGADGDLAVPEDVRVVNAEAFRGRRDVVSVDLPPSVEQIGDFAFYNCSALARITGGDGLVGVGQSVMQRTAFWNEAPDGLVTICDWVVGYKGEMPEELVIPADVRGIADSVFSGCANLKTVIYMGDPADVLVGSGAFYGTPYEMAKYPFLDSPVEANARALATGKLLFVLSGADWCPWTTVVKKYLRKLGDSFFDRFVVYYCNIDTDTYNMSRGAPSYGVFDPALFRVNWYDGRLAYDSGGVEERVQKVIDDALAAYNQPSPAAYDLSLILSGAGWHEVSFPVLPEGGKPEDVFAPVEDKIGYITFGSQNWNPLTGGTLTALEIGKGYWVQTTAESVSWTVTGQANPDVEIVLKAGWNLIGYPLLEEGEIETVLAAALATGNIRYIYSGSRVYPGTLTTMTPGKGYWVYAEAAATIRFDAP